MDRFLIKRPKNDDVPHETPPQKKNKKDYDKKYDTTQRKRTFQQSWLNEFPWLRIDDDGSAKCRVCRQFPTLADKKSGLFTGMTVTRKETLATHKGSAKHASCQLKAEHEQLKKTSTKYVGDLDKTVQKYNSSQTDRFKLLFNTAYAVAKHRKPFSDYEIYCEVQKKNGLDLGNDHLNRKACTDFIQNISDALHEGVSSKLNKSKFFTVMSDSSTGCRLNH